MKKTYHRIEIRIPVETWDILRAYGFKMNKSINKVMMGLIAKALKGMEDAL